MTLVETLSVQSIMREVTCLSFYLETLDFLKRNTGVRVLSYTTRTRGRGWGSSVNVGPNPVRT